MNKRMSPEIWNPASISKAMMDQKIKNCTTNFLAWHHIARLVLERGIPLKELKIAEVGSGTGTLSLAFALLGADVCLIDYNEKVLKSSADIYQQMILELSRYNLLSKHQRPIRQRQVIMSQFHCRPLQSLILSMEFLFPEQVERYDATTKNWWYNSLFFDPSLLLR